MDKSEQALYDGAKSLIFNAPLCTACFCSTHGIVSAAPAARSIWHFFTTDLIAVSAYTKSARANFYAEC
ncbi:MAG TPA: hypothetical protein PKM45_01515, partial [Giesbergeria sp.]|nr:hypothetical protein [Giesbergeria sp.]